MAESVVSDLFYGTPPPKSPSIHEATQTSNEAYAELDPNSVKTPGHAFTSPPYMSGGNDDIAFDYSFVKTPGYIPSSTQYELDNQNSDVNNNTTNTLFHPGTADDVYMSAKTPGYTDTQLANMPGFYHSDEYPGGAKTPGYPNAFPVNATTPYHFGSSPGPEMLNVENAEAARARIYESLAESQTASLGNQPAHPSGSRNSRFAEAAARFHAPTDAEVFGHDINDFSFNAWAPQVTSEGSSSQFNQPVPLSAPYHNPNDPRRNRRKPARLGYATSIESGSIPESNMLTPLPDFNNGNSFFDERASGYLSTPGTMNDASLDNVSVVASMASIDAPVPNLYPQFNPHLSQSISNPNLGSVSGVVEPFKVPMLPASAYNIPGAGRRLNAKALPASNGGHTTGAHRGHAATGGRGGQAIVGGGDGAPEGNANDRTTANPSRAAATGVGSSEKPTPSAKALGKRPAWVNGIGPRDDYVAPTVTPASKTNKRKKSLDNSGGVSGDDASPKPAAKKRSSKVPRVEVPKPVKTPKAKTPKERTRAPPKAGKIIDNKPIPRSFAECDEADRALITMRDAGISWALIKIEYSKISGETYGHSTLPNRYERLKANFITIREEDNILILEAKKEIEAEFDLSKWASIAERVIEKNGGSYDGVTLQRQYKKLMTTAGFNVKSGMARQDVDFQGYESGGDVPDDADADDAVDDGDDEDDA